MNALIVMLFFTVIGLFFGLFFVKYCLATNIYYSKKEKILAVVMWIFILDCFGILALLGWHGTIWIHGLGGIPFPVTM